MPVVVAAVLLGVTRFLVIFPFIHFTNIFFYFVAFLSHPLFHNLKKLSHYEKIFFSYFILLPLPCVFSYDGRKGRVDSSTLDNIVLLIFLSSYYISFE